MSWRNCLLVFGVAMALQAQMQMSVSQLADSIRSSIALQHDDKKVAEYVKKVKLTDKLTDKAIQDLLAQGAGPKTIQALKQQRDATANLKPPATDPTYSPSTLPDAGVTAGTGGVTVGPKATTTLRPPPDSVRQSEILDQVKQYASTYTQSLPNFICTQVTRRFVDPNWSRGGVERYRIIDTITARLSYHDGHEDYQTVLLNNQPIVGNVDERQLQNGTRSSGEFGTLMAKIFERQSEAQFNWDHWGNLGLGKYLAVFNYFIDSGHSSYSIGINNGGGEQRIITAYKGLIYADPDTGAIYEITFDAVDIPSSFAVRSAQEKLDYREVEISGNRYICPLRARVYLQEGREKTRNDIEFRLYRKFGTESTIKFETPAPLPDEKLKEQPINADPSLPSSATGLPPPPSPPQ